MATAMEKFTGDSKYIDNINHGETGAPDTYIAATPKEEAAVIRKLDYRLLPLVFVSYSLSVLDRSNSGNAKLAGLQKDIDLTGYKYNWSGTLFYIAYIFFQWTTLGWKHFKPHKWAAFVVFFWGFIATIQAAVFNWQGSMTCRFFLGVAESMYGPGVPLYSSFFYPREKIGFRHGVFISGAAMANAYGGASAYGLSHIHGSLAPWKISFIIEGSPTCVIALVAWFFLPDSLETTSFLSEREKQIAIQFVARNQRRDTGHTTGSRWREAVSALKDPKSYIPGLMYFGCNVSFASLPLFVPTIISEMGSFTQIQSNGLSAPPYSLCFFTILILAFLSDRFRMRGPFCGGAASVAAIGFILQATTKSVASRYVGVFSSINIFASVALTSSWTANSHVTESKRAGGMSISATIGQCGPLLGTNVFPADEAPYYRKGMWISASFCSSVAFLSAMLSTILIWENRKMEKAGLVESPENEVVDAPAEIRSEPEKFKYIW